MVYEIFALGRKPFFGLKNDEVIKIYDSSSVVLMKIRTVCCIIAVLIFER